MADSAVSLAKLVLRHRGDALTAAFRLSGTAWRPALASRVLRLLRSDVGKFLRLFRWLSRHRPACLGPDASDLLVDALGRARRYDALRRALDRHPSPSARTVAIAAERLASARRLDLAAVALPSPPTLASLNAFLATICRSGRVAEADSIFRSLRRQLPPDVITFNTMADGWCRVGSIERAVATLRDMVEVAGIQPSAASYNILLKGYFETGRNRKAWEFFKEMVRRGCEPDVVTYTTLISGFGHSGNVGRARQIFERTMVRAGCQPNVATYNAMIQLLCRKVCIEQGLDLFNQMKNRGCDPNQTTYSVLLKGLCDAHRINQAMEFLARMKGEHRFSPTTQTYNILIRGFCNVREVDRARMLLAEMANDGCIPNCDSYSILVSAFCNMRKKKEVLASGKLLLDMIQKGFLPQRLTFNRVMNGLILTGSQEFAREILRRHSRHGHLPRCILL